MGKQQAVALSHTCRGLSKKSTSKRGPYNLYAHNTNLYYLDLNRMDRLISMYRPFAVLQRRANANHCQRPNKNVRFQSYGGPSEVLRLEETMLPAPASQRT